MLNTLALTETRGYFQLRLEVPVLKEGGLKEVLILRGIPASASFALCVRVMHRRYNARRERGKHKREDFAKGV